MKKDLVYERLFGSNRNPRIFEEEETPVASHAYKFAYDAIHSGSDESDADSEEGYDEKVEAALIRFERVAEIFKKSGRARKDFLRSYASWGPLCKETVQTLRKIAEELKADKLNRDIIRACGAAVGAIGGIVLALTLSGPFALAGGAFFLLGNATVVGITSQEVQFVQKRLKKVKKLIKVEREKFASMTHWFSHPEELEKVVNSLIDCNILKEISQEVRKLSEEVTVEKNMSDEELKNQFQKVLKHCMEHMAKDTKMVEEFGKDLSPAAMTFVFMVVLMKEHNRITFDCSAITQHLALGLLGSLDFGGIAGYLLSGGEIAKTAISECFVWFGVAIDALIVVCSLVDICRRPETRYTQQIKDAADKMEKVFLFIENVYNETMAFKSVDENQCTIVVINKVPDHAVIKDLQRAIKHCVPEKALRRIQIRRLPTEDNNWLVKVPGARLQKLLQLTRVNIKGKDCAVTH